jgi:hypothetical protein
MSSQGIGEHYNHKRCKLIFTYNKMSLLTFSEKGYSLYIYPHIQTQSGVEQGISLVKWTLCYGFLKKNKNIIKKTHITIHGSDFKVLLTYLYLPLFHKNLSTRVGNICNKIVKYKKWSRKKTREFRGKNRT